MFVFIKRYGSRNWAVYDGSGILVCVTLYRKGAEEVVRRLSIIDIEEITKVKVSQDTLKQLHGELNSVKRKFNQLMKEIKSIESESLEAISYNQN